MHCIISGGGLTVDHKIRKAKSRFFIPVQVLRDKFKGKVLDKKQAAGGLLGVVGMYLIADFPAQDVLNAAAVGIASGFAATGINQVYKQFTK